MNIIQNIKCLFGVHTIEEDDPRWPICSWCIFCHKNWECTGWMKYICLEEKERRRWDKTYLWHPIERDIPGYINNWYDTFDMSREEKDKAALDVYKDYKNENDKTKYKSLYL